MSAPSPHRIEEGFTLVEVLVSLFIFALISVGAMIALTATLDARERADERIEQIERLAAARRLLADDIAASVSRRDRDGLGGFVDVSQQMARPDQLVLTRRGRPNPEGAFPRGDLLRVAWRVENGQLIRAFLPHENPAYVEDPIDRVVLDGVDAMTVEPVFESIRSIRELLDGVRDGTSMRSRPPQAIAILLSHADGTTTEHVFEMPDV